MRRSFRWIALTLPTLVSVPLVVWLSRITPLAALFFLIPLPYVRKLDSPWASTSTAWTTCLALAWFGTSLVFAFL